VRGPVGAFVLVGFETLAGTFVLMWVTMLVWRIVDRGHYRAAAWCLVPLVAALSFALRRDLRTEGFVLAGLIAAFLLAVYTQRPLLEVATGALASLISVWLILQGGSQSCGGCRDGILLAVAGTFFLGAVTHANGDSFLFRVTPAGELDSSFGTGGKVLMNVSNGLGDGIRGLVAQPDGKILGGEPPPERRGPEWGGSGAGRRRDRGGGERHVGNGLVHELALRSGRRHRLRIAALRNRFDHRGRLCQFHPDDVGTT